MLDTPTDQLKQDYLENKTVRVVLKKPLEEMPTIMGTTAQSEEDGVIVFSVDTSKHKLKNFLPAMLETVEVADMTIEDTPLEDIIHELYVRQEQ